METRSYVRIACLVALLSAPLGAGAQRGPGGSQRGGWMGGSEMPPISGAVTAVTASDLTLRTAEGESYKVSFSVNTRFIKDRQPGKSSDVKVGDTVVAVGVVDARTRSVAAAIVAELDPEQRKKLHDLQANYGKTWLAGKVSAMDETRLTIVGVDGKPASFVVDENTSMKKRRDSVTLADIKVGDQVWVQGEVKNKTFYASMLNLGGPRPEGERGMRQDPGMGQPVTPQP